MSKKDPEPLRVLVVARSYPNPELPLLGLWTQRLVHSVTGFSEVKVLSPVPYAPPVPAFAGLDYYKRFQRVPRRRWDGPVEVLHPRMLIGPGYSTRGLEALSYELAARPEVGRLRKRFDFDLIHAHFTYPDGVVACRLGRRYGVPVVVSEHVPWLPEPRDKRLVGRQTRWAARACDALLPVSRYVSQTISEAIEAPAGLRDPVPVLVDDEEFRAPQDVVRRPFQLLFVGAVRHTKGADVLIDALVTLRSRYPEVRLVMAGEPFYRSYRRQSEEILEQAVALGVRDCIEVLGRQSPQEVARLMSESAVLVVPSRAESFGSVLIEALACGTPVVATRSGGPEDIVTPEVGRLVPTEDPDALADAIGGVFDNPRRYPPETLRGYAVGRFGREVISARLRSHYEAAVGKAFSGADTPNEAIAAAGVS